MRDSRCSDTPKVTGHEHEDRHKMSDRLRAEHPRQTKDITVKQERNLSVSTSASRLSYRAGPTAPNACHEYHHAKRTLLAPVTR
jgi:hypothetical protein